MKNSLLTIALGFNLFVLAGPAKAEDPLLGIVRAVKCLNCVPDSVVLLVDDPIEQKEIEVTVPSRDYNKIMVSLQGRSLHTRDEACFYWVEKLKVPAAVTSYPTAATSDAKPTKPATPAKTSKSGNSADSNSPAMAALPPSDSDKAKFTTKESACIPYHAKSQGVH